MAWSRFFVVMLTLRVDALYHFFGVGVGSVLGVLNRLVHLCFDPGSYLLFLLLVEQLGLFEVLLEAEYRVLLAPAFDLLAFPVAPVVVVGGVGCQAVGLCFYER